MPGAGANPYAGMMDEAVLARAASMAGTMARMAARGAPEPSVLEDRLAFEKRHPQVTIIPSGQSKSGLWEAEWPGRADDEVARHDTCAGLLIYLKARFDVGDLSRAPDGDG